MRKDGFTVCAKHYIKCLRQEGRYATAHVYESALRSFTMFCGTAGCIIQTDHPWKFKEV